MVCHGLPVRSHVFQQSGLNTFHDKPRSRPLVRQSLQSADETNWVTRHPLLAHRRNGPPTYAEARLAPMRRLPAPPTQGLQPHPPNPAAWLSLCLCWSHRFCGWPPCVESVYTTKPRLKPSVLKAAQLDMSSYCSACSSATAAAELMGGLNQFWLLPVYSCIVMTATCWDAGNVTSRPSASCEGPLLASFSYEHTVAPNIDSRSFAIASTSRYTASQAV